MDPIPGVPIFGWCPMPDSSGQIKMRALTAQFGDGYAQSVRDGINNVLETWSLQFAGRSTRIAPVRAFLLERGGDLAFHWTPPLGELGLFRCTEFSLRQQSKTVYVLAATFVPAFRP